jgi:chromosome segregation ATPase
MMEKHPTELEAEKEALAREIAQSYQDVRERDRRIAELEVLLNRRIKECETCWQRIAELEAESKTLLERNRILGKENKRILNERDTAKARIAELEAFVRRVSDGHIAMPSEAKELLIERSKC